ncbi:MAG: hypothetical protein ABTA16_15455 [Niallia sp.]
MLGVVYLTAIVISVPFVGDVIPMVAVIIGNQYGNRILWLAGSKQTKNG